MFRTRCSSPAAWPHSFPRVEIEINRAGVHRGLTNQGNCLALVMISKRHGRLIHVSQLSSAKTGAKNRVGPVELGDGSRKICPAGGIFGAFFFFQLLKPP